MVCWPMCMAASWPTPNTTSAKKKLMAQYAVDTRHVENHRNMHQQFIEQVQVLWAQRSAMGTPALPCWGF